MAAVELLGQMDVYLTELFAILKCIGDESDFVCVPEVDRNGLLRSAASTTSTEGDICKRGPKSTSKPTLEEAHTRDTVNSSRRRSRDSFYSAQTKEARDFVVSPPATPILSHPFPSSAVLSHGDVGGGTLGVEEAHTPLSNLAFFDCDGSFEASALVEDAPRVLPTALEEWLNTVLGVVDSLDTQTHVAFIYKYMDRCLSYIRIHEIPLFWRFSDISGHKGGEMEASSSTATLSRQYAASLNSSAQDATSLFDTYRSSCTHYESKCEKRFSSSNLWENCDALPLSTMLPAAVFRFFRIFTFIVEILAQLFGGGELNVDSEATSFNAASETLSPAEHFSNAWDNEMRSTLESFLTRVSVLLNDCRPSHTFQVIQTYLGQQLHRYYHLSLNPILDRESAAPAFRNERHWKMVPNRLSFTSRWHDALHSRFSGSWVGFIQKMTHYDAMNEEFEAATEVPTKTSTLPYGAHLQISPLESATVDKHFSEGESQNGIVRNYPYYPKTSDGPAGLHRHTLGEPASASSTALPYLVSSSQIVQAETQALFEALCEYCMLFSSPSPFHLPRSNVNLPFTAAGKENQAKNPSQPYATRKGRHMDDVALQKKASVSAGTTIVTNAEAVKGVSALCPSATIQQGEGLGGLDSQWAKPKAQKERNSSHRSICSLAESIGAYEERYSPPMTCILSNIMPHVYGSGSGPSTLPPSVVKIPSAFNHLAVLGDIFSILGQQSVWREALEHCIIQCLQYLLENHCIAKLSSPQLAPILTVLSHLLPVVRICWGLGGVLYLQDSCKKDFAVSVYTHRASSLNPFLVQVGSKLMLLGGIRIEYDFNAFCGRVLTLILEKYGSLRVYQLMDILYNCPVTLPALMDLKACENHLRECRVAGFKPPKFTREYVGSQIPKQLALHLAKAETSTLSMIDLSLSILMLLRHFELDDKFVDDTLALLSSFLRSRQDLDTALFQRLGEIRDEERKLNVTGMYQKPQSTSRFDTNKFLCKVDDQAESAFVSYQMLFGKRRVTKGLQFQKKYGLLWYYIDALGTPEMFAAHYEQYIGTKYLSSGWHQRNAAFLGDKRVSDTRLETSQSEKLEAAMLKEDMSHVEFLQARLGRELTSKLQIMIEDMYLNLQFQGILNSEQEVLDTPEEKAICIYTCICSRGYWPDSVINLSTEVKPVVKTLPKILEQVLLKHSTLYTISAPGRVLEYREEGSSVEIDIAGESMQFPFVQAAILLMLEEAEALYASSSTRNFSLTMREIAEILGTTENCLQPHIRALVDQHFLCRSMKAGSEVAYGFADSLPVRLPSDLPVANSANASSSTHRVPAERNAAGNHLKPSTQYAGSNVAKDISNSIFFNETYGAKLVENSLADSSNRPNNRVGSGTAPTAAAESSYPVHSIEFQDTAEEADIDLSTMPFPRSTFSPSDTWTQEDASTSPAGHSILDPRLQGYENLVLDIIKDRAEKLSHAAVDTQAKSTPTGVILGRINEVSLRNKQEILKHSDVLAILNWMESQKQIRRICGNWVISF